MPPLVQASIVVATLAFVAVSIAAIRAIRRLEKTADLISTTAEQVSGIVTEMKAVTQQAHDIVSGLRGVVPPVQRTAQGFEHLGQRVLMLSHEVIDEIAAPVGLAAAIVRGVRSGAGTLLSRLRDRAAHLHTAADGDRKWNGGQS